MISVAVLNAERDVLSAMLCPDADLEQARSILRPEHFSIVPSRLVFEAVIASHQAGNPITLANLVHELEQRGELARAGGAHEIAALLSIATSGANLKSHARILIAHHARRVTRRLADEFVQSLDDPTLEVGETISQIMGRLGSAQYQAAPEAAIERFLGQIMTERQLMEADLPELESVVGHGLIVKGGLALLAGLPGAGKTFLANQLIQAVGHGIPWLGYPTTQGRAGFLQLEMPAIALRDRMRSGINGSGPSEAIDVLAFPDPMGPIRDSTTQAVISAWCVRRQLELLVIDPWNQVKSGSENSQDDMGADMDAIKSLARRTGTAILVLHHINKLQFEKGVDVRTAALQSVRGSGALTSYPSTVLVMGHAQGRTRLVFGKTWYMAPPSGSFIDLRQTETGYFERTETPAEVSDLTDEKITKCLTFYGSQGALAGEVCSTTRMARATFYRHADRMGLVVIGKRYFLPLYAPEETRRMEGI